MSSCCGYKPVRVRLKDKSDLEHLAEKDVIVEENGRRWYVNMVPVSNEQYGLVSQFISYIPADSQKAIESRLVSINNLSLNAEKKVVFGEGSIIDDIGTGKYVKGDRATGELYYTYSDKLRSRGLVA
jgi:hypothetical protein